VVVRRSPRFSDMTGAKLAHDWTAYDDCILAPSTRNRVVSGRAGRQTAPVPRDLLLNSVFLY